MHWEEGVGVLGEEEVPSGGRPAPGASRSPLPVVTSVEKTLWPPWGQPVVVVHTTTELPLGGGS